MEFALLMLGGIGSVGPQWAPGGVFKNFRRPRGAPLRSHQKYMGFWGGGLWGPWVAAEGLAAVFKC